MARIEDIERRLLNWARWRLGATRSPLGYAQAQFGERVDGEGWDAPAVIPTVDAEAAETDRAVGALDSRLRRTVEVAYLHGGGIARKLQMLACSRATLHARIDEAHRKLSGWFTDQHRQAQAERQRVEQLQRRAGGR